MDRKAFLEKKDNNVFIYVENIASGERELMATYSITKGEMKLHDVPRYFNILRHVESLNLILGRMEENGWINPVGDREPLNAEEEEAPAAPETKVSKSDDEDKCTLTWLVKRDVLKQLMDSPKFIEGHFDLHSQFVPYIESLDSYVIATSVAKKKDGGENAGPLTYISPSMRQSLEVVTGLGKDDLSQFIATSINVYVGEPLTTQSSIFDLKDTTTFTDLKRAVSELRKKLK